MNEECITVITAINSFVTIFLFNSPVISVKKPLIHKK